MFPSIPACIEKGCVRGAFYHNYGQNRKADHSGGKLTYFYPSDFYCYIHHIY